MQQTEALAGEGKRVLGFAYKTLTAYPKGRSETSDYAQPSGKQVLGGLSVGEMTEEDAESELIWLGLVAMMDAARPEVGEAVRRCQRAGIRPVMITGDHPLTAKALAVELGMVGAEARAFSGQEIEAMDRAGLEAVVGSTSVYARVSPEHKLRIVRALQAQGQVVAMTGDGVNDAPALKQADIGIAMGIMGTDVSKGGERYGAAR